MLSIGRYEAEPTRIVFAALPKLLSIFGPLLNVCHVSGVAGFEGAVRKFALSPRQPHGTPGVVRTFRLNSQVAFGLTGISRDGQVPRMAR